MASIRLTVTAKDEIRSVLRGILENLKTTTPFPVPKEEVYDRVYTPSIPENIREHIVALNDIGADAYKYMKHSYWQGVNIRTHHNTESISIYSDDKPGKSGNTTVELWHPMYEELVAWATDARAVQDRVNKTNNTIDYVIELCNTGGQIRLVWPELVGLIPADLQVKLEGTIARKVPFLGNHYDSEYEMREAINKATIEIATANVLPEYDNNDLWI